LPFYKRCGHIIRRLRIMNEISSGGEPCLYREDAQTLLDIKNGKWTFEQVSAEADRLNAELYAAYLSRNIPQISKPNNSNSTKLFKTLMEMSYGFEDLRDVK